MVGRRDLAEAEFGNQDLANRMAANGVSASLIEGMCGPIAAAAALKAYGLPADPAALARWGQDNGEWAGYMTHGSGAGLQKLLASQGLQSTVEAADPAIAARAIQQGGVAVLNFPNHYMTASDYDPATGKFYVGNTGSNALRGGSDWMTFAEMQAAPGNGGGLRSVVVPTGASDPGGVVPAAPAGYPATPAAPLAQGGVDRGGALDPSAAPETTWQLADRKSAEWGLGDPNVLRALVLAESGGNPAEIGDNGQSYGLLQAYTGRGGGRGTGHDPQRLLDPEYNLDIAKGEITAAYRQALGEGYREGTPDLARRVGELAQRPDPAFYHRYADAYTALQAGGPPAVDTSNVPPAPRALPSGLGGRPSSPSDAAAAPTGPPWAARPTAPPWTGSPSDPSLWGGLPSDQPAADPWGVARSGLAALTDPLAATGRSVASLPETISQRLVAGLPALPDPLAAVRESAPAQSPFMARMTASVPSLPSLPDVGGLASGIGRAVTDGTATPEQAAAYRAGLRDATAPSSSAAPASWMAGAPPMGDTGGPAAGIRPSFPWPTLGDRSLDQTVEDIVRGQVAARPELRLGFRSSGSTVTPTFANPLPAAEVLSRTPERSIEAALTSGTYGRGGLAAAAADPRGGLFHAAKGAGASDETAAALSTAGQILLDPTTWAGAEGLATRMPGVRTLAATLLLTGGLGYAYGASQAPAGTAGVQGGLAGAAALSLVTLATLGGHDPAAAASLAAEIRAAAPAVADPAELQVIRAALRRDLPDAHPMAVESLAQSTAQKVAGLRPVLRRQIMTAYEHGIAGGVTADGGAPWQQTRAAFEATGQDLLHGTTRPFAAFDPQAALNRYGTPPRTSGVYFTERPAVARTFATASGNRAVDLDAWMAEHGVRDAREAVPQLKAALDGALASGRSLWHVDPATGEIARLPNAAALPDAALLDGDPVYLFAAGRAPRTIAARVYGRTLDLTDPRAIPYDLRAVLEPTNYHPWEAGVPDYAHEFTPQLIDYARTHGYGRVLVRDVAESGGRSTLALPEFVGYGRDPHRAFVEQALARGEPVPPAVLADYPDLGAAVPGRGLPARDLPDVGAALRSAAPSAAGGGGSMGGMTLDEPPSRFGLPSLANDLGTWRPRITGGPAPGGFGGLRPHVEPPAPVPPTTWQLLDRQLRAYTAADLLSSIPGIVRNLGGGPTMTGTEVGTTALSPLNEAALRGGKALITRLPVIGGGAVPARSRFFSEVPAALQGAREGVGPGAKAALGTLLGSGHQAGLTNLEQGREIVGGSLNLLNWVLRTYGANDAQLGAVGTRLGDRVVAQRLARQQGLTGAAASARADFLADLAAARRAEDVAGAPRTVPPLFRAAAETVRKGGDVAADRLTLRDGFGAMEKHLNGLNKIPYLGPLLMPFSRGVNASIKAGYQHSPLAFGELLARGLRPRQGLPAGYGDMADRLSRAEMGTATMLGAVGLYNSGLLVGAAPKDPKLRAQWDAEGHVPYSFDLGVHAGQRYSLPFSVFTPLAPTLMATTAYLDSVRDGKPLPQQGIAAGQGYLDGVGNLPVLQAWGDVTDMTNAARTGDANAIVAAVGRQLTAHAAGLIPASGFLRSVERTAEVDPYRRAPSGGPLERAGQSLQAGIPVIGGGVQEPPPDAVASGEVPPAGAGIRAVLRQTPLGDILAPRILPRQGPLGERLPNPSGLGNIVNPLRATEPSSEADATYTEAARTGMGLPTAPTTVQAEGGPVHLSPEQQYHYNEVQGRFVGSYRDALYATPRYQQVPLATQQALTKATDALARADAHDVALADMGFAPPRAAGEPVRYDVASLTPTLRGRIPDPVIAAYVAHPALFEADARRAARKFALYRASRGTTPPPSHAEVVMARMAEARFRTRAWQLWARDPVRRQQAAAEDAFLTGLGVDSVGQQVGQPAAPAAVVPAA